MSFAYGTVPSEARPRPASLRHHFAEPGFCIASQSGTRVGASADARLAAPPAALRAAAFCNGSCSTFRGAVPGRPCALEHFTTEGRARTGVGDFSTAACFGVKSGVLSATSLCRTASRRPPCARESTRLRAKRKQLHRNRSRLRPLGKSRRCVRQACAGGLCLATDCGNALVLGSGGCGAKTESAFPC